jgi:hypothetical protein
LDLVADWSRRGYCPVFFDRLLTLVVCGGASDGRQSAGPDALRLVQAKESGSEAAVLSERSVYQIKTSRRFDTPDR